MAKPYAAWTIRQKFIRAHTRGEARGYALHGRNARTTVGLGGYEKIEVGVGDPAESYASIGRDMHIIWSKERAWVI